jgi:hypothetical protein
VLPIWVIGPCIMLESIRDVSKGPWSTLGLIKQYPLPTLGFGFCLDYSVLQFRR